MRIAKNARLADNHLPLSMRDAQTQTSRPIASTSRTARSADRNKQIRIEAANSNERPPSPLF